MRLVFRAELVEGMDRYLSIPHVQYEHVDLSSLYLTNSWIKAAVFTDALKMVGCICDQVCQGPHLGAFL